MSDETHARRSGVLLHPTSLPGLCGVGELGEEALEFVEFLGAARQSVWQVLPLTPTDDAGSPYSSPSAFAGNPLLVSTGNLVRDGLIPHPPVQRPVTVDYGKVRKAKSARLREAFSRWSPNEEFEEFREGNEDWLEDYALFAAFRGRFAEPWNRWPRSLAGREPDALKSARRDLEDEVLFHQFVQFRFQTDWRFVKRAAEAAGIRIVGDVPIFISHDSADVWANRELFLLDANGDPEVVAGVPPDYFSKTGQLWGNPLYDWEKMAKDGYSWWVSRVKRALALCDTLRLDHFRGFVAHWEIPARERTAKNGRWVEGPGELLFTALRRSMGELPLIAEDLGEITPEVARLRERLGLPGMKVLQFAFSDPGSPFLPHNFCGSNWVAYTGTHDNDTTRGWWRDAAPKERDSARRYLGKEYAGTGDFVRLAHASTAKWSIVPMQDLLGLGSEARMNTPGTPTGNWTWRLREVPGERVARGLAELTTLYGRG